MSSSQYTLSVANEKIWNFYKKYPSLSFEAANLLFIDFMEKIIPDTKNGLTTSLAEQLVDQMKHIQNQMISVTDNISHIRNENLNHITLKLSEFKKDYMEDIKMILTNNVADKIAPLLKEQNSIMIDKTNILINDILPKNNETLSKQMNESIKTLHYSITEDTNKFLSSSINPRTLQDFISNLEQKFTQSEQRIETNIREIKITNDNIREISTAHQQTSLSLNATVNDMLKKMENTSTKGKISENIVFNILNNLFPSATDIEYVGDKKESGDIMLVRENKPTILIENKNWDKIVSKEEVKKFIHDVETQNCCGLFLSQNTGIANKRNFEISIHNNKHILLFMHEVNYDAERIKLGVEIIDHFKETLDKFDDKSEIDTIDKDVLDCISKEYQECCSQKLNIIKMIKDFGVKLTKQVEEISFPNLENYLSTRYTFSVGKMVCEYCNFIAKNQQALSAHQRGCLVRKNMTKSEVLTTIHTDVKTNNSAAAAPSPATAVKDTNVIVKDTSVKDKIIKEIIKDKKTKLNM
jgi:hypothetical protein